MSRGDGGVGPASAAPEDAMAERDDPNPDAVEPGSAGAGEDVCRACEGSGRRGEAVCGDCGGTGVVTTGIGGG